MSETIKEESSTLTHPEILSSRPQPLVRNYAVTVVWRSLLTAIALTGFIISATRTTFVADLVYFTRQSNILVLVCMLYVLWGMLRHRPAMSPAWKSAITVYITITCLVFNLILAPTLVNIPAVPNGLDVVLPWNALLLNELQHKLIPALFILDWLFFDAHSGLRWRNALIWLSYPVGYLVFAVIRGLFVHSYPYPFWMSM